MTIEHYDDWKQVHERYPQCSYEIYNAAVAEERVRERIAEDLWAFHAGYLADMTSLPEVIFSALSNQMNEDASPHIRRLIDVSCGFEAFALDVIKLNGRGFYLADYDGHEQTIKVDGRFFYVYRNQ